VSSYYHAKKREAEPAAREMRDAGLKEKIMEVWEGEKGRKVYGARMRGTVLRVTVAHLPDGRTPPKPMWLWHAGPGPLSPDELWRAYPAA
jgi:hypothetical protein